MCSHGLKSVIRIKNFDSQRKSGTMKNRPIQSIAKSVLRLVRRLKEKTQILHKYDMNLYKSIKGSA